MYRRSRSYRLRVRFRRSCSGGFDLNPHPALNPRDSNPRQRRTPALAISKLDTDHCTMPTSMQNSAKWSRFILSFFFYFFFSLLASFKRKKERKGKKVTLKTGFNLHLAILSPIMSRHRLESPWNDVAAMGFVVTRLISAPNHRSRHPFECLNTSTLHCATPSRTAAS